MFFNWANFPGNMLHEYFTFNISFVKFPVMLPINEYYVGDEYLTFKIYYVKFPV